MTSMVFPFDRISSLFQVQLAWATFLAEVDTPALDENSLSELKPQDHCFRPPFVWKDTTSPLVNIRLLQILPLVS